LNSIPQIYFIRTKITTHKAGSDGRGKRVWEAGADFVDCGVGGGSVPERVGEFVA